MIRLTCCSATRFCLLFAALLPALAYSEMSPLGDDALADVSGQGGIYLSGDISINEMGGPVQNNYFGRCDEADKKCGARFAYRLKQDGGWMVLDEIRGMFAFEGLTLRVRSIDSGFGGDGALFDRDVIELNDLPLATPLATCKQNVADPGSPCPHGDIDVFVKILRHRDLFNKGW